MKIIGLLLGSFVLTFLLAPAPAQARWCQDINGRYWCGDPDFQEPEVLSIPVYFHLIQESEEASVVLSDRVLAHYIDALNASYSFSASSASSASDADAPHRFVMGGVTRTTNPEWYRMTQQSDAERQAKSALRQGGADTLNIYVADLPPGVNGWSFVRGNGDNLVDAVMDGLVVDYETLAESGAPLAEVGQWLGIPDSKSGRANRARLTRLTSNVSSISDWFGAANSGGGVALVDLNGNGRPEMITFFVTNPAGPNYGYYRVGFDINSNGQPAGVWSARKDIPITFGSETDGADVAAADINGNGRPDLIVYYIDDLAGENTGRYRIGFDLDSNGDARLWTDARVIPGWFGADDQGAGLAVADLNGNNMPELIAFFLENPSGENRGWYRIGWDLDSNGIPTGNWSSEILIPYWFGASNEDAGIAVSDINNNGTPDLLVFFVTNPSGENSGYYRIGWDLSSSGTPTLGWNVHVDTKQWFGADTDAAGVAVEDLNGSGQKDFVVFFITDPPGENQGYYHIGWENGATW